jgi:hypothetical protein
MTEFLNLYISFSFRAAGELRLSSTHTAGKAAKSYQAQIDLNEIGVKVGRVRAIIRAATARD